jgi:hypothetical protein
VLQNEAPHDLQTEKTNAYIIWRTTLAASMRHVAHGPAGDGDEVLAPSSEGVDTDGIKGADVATPPGAATVVDPNGEQKRQRSLLHLPFIAAHHLHLDSVSVCSCDR